MMLLHVFLLSFVFAQAQTLYPLAYVYQTGMESLLEGDHERALEAFAEIMDRMPHDGRARYDAAGVLFELESYAEADTLVSAGELSVEADSAASASAATHLGSSIATDDYEGVQSSLEELRRILVGDDSHECDRTNYEVALNWLRNHEPPEEQGNGDSDEQSDQSEDSQDDQDQQSDDSEDQSDNAQEDSQDSEDQSEDQEDSEDSEDQPEDQEDQETEAPPPPPSSGEMSEEDAERILELVEEAEPPDSTEGGKAYAPGGPVW